MPETGPNRLSRRVGKPACPICDQPVGRSAAAGVAPFVKSRTGVSAGREAKAHYCDACEHLFFTPLLTEKQLARLYTGYRDAAYTAERLAVEPGYAPYAEDFAHPESRYHKIRRAFYDFFLSEFRDFKGLVVDFGGGDGGFTRYIFPAAEIVVADETYEREGGDLAGLLGRTDLLFAAHVLEHLPQPRLALSRMTSGLRPGAKVYVELPFDYVGRLKDAFAAIERAPPGAPFGPLQVLHEHVAHFSRRSALRLLRSCGLRVSETAYSGPEIPLQALMARKPRQ